MIDRFTELLQELGKILDISLHPDEHQSCALLVDEKLKLQLELDKSLETLIVGAHLGIVPPGKFRENLLAHALKANAIFPRMGTFGYSPYHNQMAFFEFLPLNTQNGEKLADFLAMFIAKAKEWKEALESGILPNLQFQADEKLSSPLIKPIKK